MNPKFAHLYDKDIPNDITVGLVLHLDPDVLEKEGGTFTCDPAFRVQDQLFLSAFPSMVPLPVGYLFTPTRVTAERSWTRRQRKGILNGSKVSITGTKPKFGKQPQMQSILLPVAHMTNRAKALETPLPRLASPMSNIPLQRDASPASRLRAPELAR